MRWINAALLLTILLLGTPLTYGQNKLLSCERTDDGRPICTDSVTGKMIFVSEDVFRAYVSKATIDPFRDTSKKLTISMFESMDKKSEKNWTCDDFSVDGYRMCRTFDGKMNLALAEVDDCAIDTSQPTWGGGEIKYAGRTQDLGTSYKCTERASKTEVSVPVSQCFGGLLTANINNLNYTFSGNFDTRSARGLGPLCFLSDGTGVAVLAEQGPMLAATFIKQREIKTTVEKNATAEAGTKGPEFLKKHPSDWSIKTSEDEMAGTKESVLFSEQSFDDGASAELEMQCTKEREIVVYATFYLDKASGEKFSNTDHKSARTLMADCSFGAGKCFICPGLNLLSKDWHDVVDARTKLNDKKPVDKWLCTSGYSNRLAIASLSLKDRTPWGLMADVSTTTSSQIKKRLVTVPFEEPTIKSFVENCKKSQE